MVQWVFSFSKCFLDAAQVPDGERLQVTYVTMLTPRERDAASLCHTPCIPAGATSSKLTCASAGCAFILPGCSRHPVRDIPLLHWAVLHVLRNTVTQGHSKSVFSTQRPVPSGNHGYICNLETLYLKIFLISYINSSQKKIKTGYLLYKRN